MTKRPDAKPAAKPKPPPRSFTCARCGIAGIACALDLDPVTRGPAPLCWDCSRYAGAALASLETAVADLEDVVSTLQTRPPGPNLKPYARRLATVARALQAR